MIKASTSTLVCVFFEGNNVSVGRGTETQFQIYGSPFLNDREFQFIPKPNSGSKYPKHEGLICYGKDLREIDDLEQINLEWLLDTYQQNTYENPYFTIFFTKLAGTKKLQEQIEQGFTEGEIRKTWKDDLRDFKEIRKKYLIYK